MPHSEIHPAITHFDDTARRLMVNSRGLNGYRATMTALHLEALDEHDEREAFSQNRAWAARHDLLSGRKEHVDAAIAADHAEALDEHDERRWMLYGDITDAHAAALGQDTARTLAGIWQDPNGDPQVRAAIRQLREMAHRDALRADAERAESHAEGRPCGCPGKTGTPHRIGCVWPGAYAETYGCRIDDCVLHGHNGTTGRIEADAFRALAGYVERRDAQPRPVDVRITADLVRVAEDNFTGWDMRAALAAAFRAAGFTVTVESPDGIVAGPAGGGHQGGEPAWQTDAEWILANCGTASPESLAERLAALDERPTHYADNQGTACGKWSGLVYSYTTDLAQVTCAGCRDVSVPLTDVELRHWFAARGVPTADLQLYVGQNRGKTIAVLDAEYERNHGSIA